MLKLLLALLLVLPADPPIAPEPSRYHEGQVWEYRTRPGDEGSLLKIQRIEARPDGNAIYHISVIGVRLGGQPGVELQHLPVSAETLDGSVTRESSSDAAFPSPDEGIATWRRARGGVFTIPLAQIMAFVEQQIGGQPVAPAT